jgi:hypothetical protein
MVRASRVPPYFSVTFCNSLNVLIALPFSAAVYCCYLLCYFRSGTQQFTPLSFMSTQQIFIVFFHLLTAGLEVHKKGAGTFESSETQ